MLTEKQLETLREILPLVRQANLAVVQMHLPSLCSGVQELTSGLADAISGLELLLRQSR